MKNLLMSRQFLPLCLTQAFTSINDNMFKNAGVILCLILASQWGPAMVALAGAVFSAPYILFSSLAGEFADKYSKTRLIRKVKIFEIALMLLAAYGLLASNLWVMAAVLFGLGTLATFLSPLKSSLLPEHLETKWLVAANGLMDGTNFIAILVGTLLGGGLVAVNGGIWIISAMCIIFAVLGLVSARFIPDSTANSPELKINYNIVKQTYMLIKTAKEVNSVWLSVLGTAWFWTVASVIVAQFPVIAHTLNPDGSSLITFMLVLFSVGAGVGSLSCSYLLKGEISAKFVPFAALLISIFTAALSFSVHRLVEQHMSFTALSIVQEKWGIVLSVAIFLLACSGGVFAVPLSTIMQARSETEKRARVIAASNVLISVFVLIAAGLVASAATLAVSTASILATASFLNLLVAFWIVRILPQETLKLIFRQYFRVFHGVKVSGLENAPDGKSGAVLIVNHQSFLDGCLVAAFLPGNPVFAVHTDQAKKFSFLKYFMDILPVDPLKSMSTKTMIEMVKSGRTLVIFPEGRITLTTALMRPYSAPGMVAERAQVPVYTARVDGLINHVSSRVGDLVPTSLFPKFKLRFYPAISLQANPNLFGRAKRADLQTQIYDMMTKAAVKPEYAQQTLFECLYSAAQTYGWNKICVEDMAAKPLTYKKLIISSLVLGRKLSEYFDETKITRVNDEETINSTAAIMLPTSLGNLVSNLGLSFFARTFSPLNVSSGAESMALCCRAACAKTIVSSRQFVTVAKLEGAVAELEKEFQFIWLEDIRASIGLLDKIRGWWDFKHYKKLPGTVTNHAPLMCLFTSGSEGLPKGVLHSHYSILSNVSQMLAVSDFNPSDRVLNCMPMFHSYGMTGGTILPLMCGAYTLYYPSPLHYKIIPQVIYDRLITIVFGTDTFLQKWAANAEPYDFRTVRAVFSAAEAVRAETRRIWMEKFGVPLYEAYGATETGPTIAINTPMYNRVGTFGRFLPNTQTRLEQVEGFEGGSKLLVSGPQTMIGYLHPNNPGVLVRLKGEYDTGDIVRIEADNFGIFVDRARQIAKIGGEMVSLLASKEFVNQVWPNDHHAVIAIDDPKKGQRLVLVTTNPKPEVRELLEAARARKTAEIYIPKSFLSLDKIPLLGSGKIDTNQVKRLVAENNQPESSEEEEE